MKEELSALAGILTAIGFLPYIRAILRKKTKPAKASWIIWAVLDSITFAGMYAKDTLNPQMFAVVVGVWIIMALSLRYGTPGWTWTDKVCMIGAALGIAFWIVSRNPTIAIVISLIVVIIGCIPTFTSAWKTPEREDKLTWVIMGIAALCSALAIPRWTIADAAQPITYFLNNVVILLLLFIRSRAIRVSR